MRKYYIDNLRNSAILLLFPYHTCMIYNSFESFYVHGEPNRICDDFILLTGIWFMPLLFFLAGMSSFYALERRNAKSYIKERFQRLLVPFLTGILLIVPPQTYFAERFHNEYSGGYFLQYISYFTQITDLTGFRGGFTTGHLWFILYLFVIVLVSLPLLIIFNSKINRNIKLLNSPINIMLLFVIMMLCSNILDIGGKSLGLYFSLFVVGYIFARSTNIMNIIMKYRRYFLIATIIATIVFYLFYYTYGWKSGYSIDAIVFSLIRYFAMWVSILAIVAYGSIFCDYSNKITSYLTKAVFPIYLFHQTWIVICAFYIFKITNDVLIQFICIMSISFILSIVSYEMIKRINIIRSCFGIKYYN